MTVTLLTGATGTLGTALRPRLLDAGHEVRAASRSPPAEGDGDGIEWIELDLVEGTGIEAAVDGAEVVVHAATAPQGDTEAVDVEGTKRLLAAAADAGVSNFVYPSIVGVGDIPFAYYEHKSAAEEAVVASDVPESVVRATQFHEFVDELLSGVARLPLWPLPTKLESQPIDVGEAADEVAAHATPEPSGRVPAVGGPEVLTLGEMAKAYREARGLRRPIVRLPLPGKVASGFRAGRATCPDRRVGTTTWAAWLDREYGAGERDARAASASPS
ncbi:SDR family oxidoreductase [Halorientalis marina]|uniref:SDR family oxidoreductase n=1 Tax=Halorientalis marina TaxID=2931976 RepID=UPI001FF63665|nr:NAD(P)H-binding protein [Halorientalis marina]